MKRQVAVFKAKGSAAEALSKLHELADVFMTDIELWQELCDLYLQLDWYSFPQRSSVVVCSTFQL